MSNEELDQIALEIYWHLERGETEQARKKLLSVRPPELVELRAFKATALQLTTAATICHVQNSQTNPVLKNT